METRLQDPNRPSSALTRRFVKLIGMLENTLAQESALELYQAKLRIYESLKKLIERGRQTKGEELNPRVANELLRQKEDFKEEFLDKADEEAMVIYREILISVMRRREEESDQDFKAQRRVRGNSQRF